MLYILLHVFVIIRIFPSMIMQLSKALWPSPLLYQLHLMAAEGSVNDNHVENDTAIQIIPVETCFRLVLDLSAQRKTEKILLLLDQLILIFLSLHLKEDKCHDRCQQFGSYDGIPHAVISCFIARTIEMEE